MADIRCQMCGKPNPDHLEECEHCGARLKPLIAPPSSSEEPASGWAETSPEDTMGWLRSLGQDDNQYNEEQKWGNTGDLPDWLGGSPSEIEESSGADWLDAVRGGGTDSGALKEEASFESSNAESTFDQWIPTDDQASYSSEVPDQINDLDEIKSEPAASPTTEPLPSWLVDEVSSTDPDHLDSNIEEEYSTSPDDDWLNSITSDSITTMVDLPPWEKQLEDSPSEAQASEDLPAWLSPTTSDSPSTPGRDGFDDDLPTWLIGEDSTDFEQQLPGRIPTEAEEEAEGEFPDWLDVLDSKTGMTGKLGEMPNWLEEEVSSEEDSVSGGTLDWLATLGDETEIDTKDQDSGFEIDPEIGSGTFGGLTLDPEDSFLSEVEKNQTPDWLDSLQGADTDYLDAPADLPEFPSPSWDFGSQKSQGEWEETSEIEQYSSDTLAAGEDETSSFLPSWVQAFQPMEGADVATEFSGGELEHVGPLAGLRGLLSPEPDVAKISIPPAYSSRLQVSTKQQTNANLLQSLIEGESIPIPSIEASPLASQRIFRLVVGVILILTMLFPLIRGTQIIPQPAQGYSQETLELRNIINAAPVDRPVLIAFDYEPGMSGELEPVGISVLDHLMDRGVPLAIVSTSPLGNALGERQIGYLQKGFPYEHQYIYGKDYVNLGYIAGGTAGLANFAIAPRQSLLMAYDSQSVLELLDLDSVNPWLSPVMQNIRSLTDFWLTIILTDNPETARNWIEQVEPTLRANSFAMIVSTQAEPFIRPYFQNGDSTSRQVDGLLVGLQGASSYEQGQDIFGPASLYRDTFGVGLLVAVLLIVFGGGYYYLDEMNKARRLARREKSRKHS